MLKTLKYGNDFEEELFYHNDTIWIYNSDIIKTKSVEDDSIDLIVTSPP